MSNFELLKKELVLAESQYASFKDKKTKVACTRCRAHLLSIKKLCDSMRRDILNAQKSQQKGEKKEEKKKEEKKDEPVITACVLKTEEKKEEQVIPDPLEMPVLKRENTKTTIDKVVVPLVHIAKKTRKPRRSRKA